MTMYPVEHASFTRVASEFPTIQVRHQDGTITTFGSEAAFEIFKQGLLRTNYDLYDEVQERWLVGTIDQVGNQEAVDHAVDFQYHRIGND